MPIISNSGGNRVLNPNARAADVARATLDAVIPIQNRKQDAAFLVNGYTGVLYSYLTAGTKCACQSKRKAINTRLNEQGKAPPGVINEMLVPGKTFGVRAYGTHRKSDDALKAASSPTPSVSFTVDIGPHEAPVLLSSLFDESDLDTSSRSPLGSLHDRSSAASGLDADVATVLIEDDPDATSNRMSDFDGGLFGYTDISCPCCFGSGFLGGYSILSGVRYVLNFQDPSIVLPSIAVISVEKEIPPIISDSVAWTVLLPAGVESVDAIRLWNVTTPVNSGIISVDGSPLTKQAELLLYCDGRQHIISVNFSETVEFTHLEIQLNQSTFPANFELPKLSKGSNVTLRETTDPFSISLSPRIPAVKTMDVIVESTFGKALQVKSVTGINTRQYSTMGWEVEVRPTQPQELFWMLPRRSPTAFQNKTPIVRDNASPNLSFTQT